MPSTKKEFERLFEMFEEGSFVAQSGLGHRVERKGIVLHYGESDGFDDISEAQMPYKRRQACSLHKGRKKETRKAKSGFLKKVHLAPQNKEKVWNELLITTDEEEEHDFLTRVI